MQDEELTIGDKLRIYKDVVVGVMFRRFKRNYNVVDEYYDSGIYSSLKQNQLWNLSLNDLLLIDFSNTDEKDKIIVYENKTKLVRNYRNTIWTSVQDEFVDKISKFIKPDDHIVELGCGFGRHLFTLRKYGFKNKMSGSDISTNAIDVAKKINEKYDLQIDFQVADYTKKLDMDLKGKTIFTYATIEQVKDRIDDAIKNIIDSEPKQVIHFETIPQLLNNNFYKLMITLNKIRKDYPLNILNILEQNSVSITNKETLDVCTGILNPCMMVRYVP